MIKKIRHVSSQADGISSYMSISLNAHWLLVVPNGIIAASRAPRPHSLVYLRVCCPSSRGERSALQRSNAAVRSFSPASTLVLMRQQLLMHRSWHDRRRPRIRDRRAWASASPARFLAVAREMIDGRRFVLFCRPCLFHWSRA